MFKEKVYGRSTLACTEKFGIRQLLHTVLNGKKNTLFIGVIGTLDRFMENLKGAADINGFILLDNILNERIQKIRIP